MKSTRPTRRVPQLAVACLLVAAFATARLQSRAAASSSAQPSRTDLAQFIAVLHAKAQGLGNGSGMRLAFQSFTAAHQLPPDSLRYSDFRDGAAALRGHARRRIFGNMHWEITNKPPNSDNVWRQWASVRNPSLLAPTATAECDELSALYAFLVEREGVRGVGLFWPYPNHTVAVWSLKSSNGAAIRVVVPTSQIFLEETDDCDTRKFNPVDTEDDVRPTRGAMCRIHSTFPSPCSISSCNRWTDTPGRRTPRCRRSRYRREGGSSCVRGRPNERLIGRTRQRAALTASAPAEDLAAFWNFAADMRRATKP